MSRFDFIDLLSDNLTAHVIKTSTENVKDARVKELLSGLIQHLHDYTREVQLKPHEWEAAMHYLAQVGQQCTPDRQEMVLMSDVLGLSALVDTLNSAQALADSATESSVLGPFHSHETKELANGQSIGSSGVIGELMLIHGTVRSVGGSPIQDVAVDIWETNGNGLYDMQDPDRGGPDCRGIFHTDSQGRFYLIGVKSVDYNIPCDGAVGTFLELVDRKPTRPAHVHFQLGHPFYVGLTTALYSEASAHIVSDPVFGVKKSLIKNIKWLADTGELVSKYQLDASLEHMKWDGRGLWVLEHDFVLLKK